MIATIEIRTTALAVLKAIKFNSAYVLEVQNCVPKLSLISVNLNGVWDRLRLNSGQSDAKLLVHRIAQILLKRPDRQFLLVPSEDQLWVDG